MREDSRKSWAVKKTSSQLACQGSYFMKKYSRIYPLDHFIYASIYAHPARKKIQIKLNHSFLSRIILVGQSVTIHLNRNWHSMHDKSTMSIKTATTDTMCPTWLPSQVDELSKWYILYVIFSQFFFLKKYVISLKKIF